MSAWRYVKGSEKDFIGAPEWALYCAQVKTTSGIVEAWEGEDNRYCYTPRGEGADEPFVEYDDNGFIKWGWNNPVTIIAQRERVTSINDDRLAQCIDNVNYPKHYTQGGIDCIDAIKAATVGKTGIEAVCVANVVKYLWRYEEKNGVEDVKKARWYLERLISELSEGDK